MPKEGPIVRERPKERDRPVKRPGGRRQVLMIVSIVAVLGALLVVSYIIFAPDDTRFTLSSYSYAEVDRGSIEETLQLSGALTIEYRESLLAPQAGVITEIHVAQGEDVVAGEIVAEIDPEELEESLEEKERSLERKRLEHAKLLAEREVELERLAADREKLEEAVADARAELVLTRELHEAGSASNIELEDAEDAVTVAERALAEHDRQVRLAELNHDYAVEVYRMDLAALDDTIAEIRIQIEECLVRSPLSGKVMETLVSPGDLVLQHATLMRVADLSRPVATVAVPESRIDRIYPGQPVTLTVAGEALSGSVRTVAMEAQDSGDYDAAVNVTVEFARTPQRVVPGSTVSAEIVVGEVADALYLPRGQFLATGNQLYLYVIEGERAVRVEAVFGVTTAGAVEVKSGVQEGDRVIVSGYQDFLNYEEIELRPAGGRPVGARE